jgi:hypothetical protein
MTNFRLSRRAVLRGAGGVAVALPWLEIMGGGRESHAQGATARRFLAVFNPGGTVLDKWTPTGGETDFVLSPILRPFEPVRDALVVLNGIDMKSAMSAVAEQEAGGMSAWLTGTPQASQDGYATGPSIDQVLAPSLSAGKRFSSLELAVRWGTGRCRGLVSPWDIVNFADDGAFTPIAPRLDPVAIFNDLFGGDGGTASNAAWDKSVLDAVRSRYQKLSARLGSADKQRLERHLTAIRELETKLADGQSVLARCRPPAPIDTSDYDPAAGLNATTTGLENGVDDPVTDAAIPKVYKLMTDMLVMALACDLTSVGTLMCADGECKYTLPWLGLEYTQRFYQNDGGYQPAECEAIATWYSEQNAYLLTQMASVDMGGHSLLDESVVFFGSNIQAPSSHLKHSMPFLLGGRGGGLRAGRTLTYDHPSHNDLLVSLLNLFGDSRRTFGPLMYCDGALLGLV